MPSDSNTRESRVTFTGFRTVALVATTLIALGCTPPPPSGGQDEPGLGVASSLDVTPSPSLEQLAAWMTGSFSSAEQAAADSAFFDIRLEMARVWRDRDDATWLYVEQAAASALDQPYRQRVYRVSEDGPQVYRSAVFELPDPDAMVGAFRDPERLAALDPDDLIAREGCEIELHAEGTSYVGSTPGWECLSTLRGASYATSEVVVTANGIQSWDRGWNDAGEQVWGAVKGAYRFQKVHDYEP
ncbi:MAG: chromophore lyase CpcT/CpeT [Candidatus Eisenbacteria bacterium]|uniref:Chromophore lyase CpcT/CpeT n=1 Tax=Eiseniibacteriota bacterium TaxID=2212470 RepID=A0A956NJ82_UNCEI|nr:chromophore lyase CpcT/CpeT [Candidatus Eisenbacteria bacterium]